MLGAPGDTKYAKEVFFEIPFWKIQNFRPRVHKETESGDQAQDQIYKLQLLDKK